MALAANPMSAGGIRPGPVVLICKAASDVPSAQRDAVCAALAEELATSDPDRRIQLGGATPEGAAQMALNVTGADPQELSATLDWQDGMARGSSPPLSLTAMDKPLSPEMYAPLIEALLQQSGWNHRP